MLLIYTHLPTNRVKYTFNLIFKSILGIDIEITDTTDKFRLHKGAKLSYTHRPIADEVFVKSSNLLFETGVSALIDNYRNILTTETGMETENSIDIFAFSFFLASRYEEYLPFSPDKYGRFSAQQSVTGKNDFLQKPWVNIWAKKIQEMISARYPQFIFPEKKYIYTPTIDIDNAYAYIGKNLTRTIGGYAKALAHTNKDDFSKRKNVLSGKEKDPYDTYDLQSEIHKKYGLKPVYFFLLGDWAPNDKNLSYTNPHMQLLIKTIAEQAETGIHPSFASNRNPEKIKIEKERLEKIKNGSVSRSRQHFLKLQFPATYRNLIAAGITDDYSMGYADGIGFRAGICTSYKFYDLVKEEETNFSIHPFAVMDGTLNNYLRLSPEEAIEKVKKVVQEIKNVNGEFISIWHNETLSDWKEWKGWKHIYEEVIKIATSP